MVVGPCHEICSRDHLTKAYKPWNLQMTLETKRSTMQITQNETQTTINYKQKNLRLYLIDQYNPLDL